MFGEILVRQTLISWSSLYSLDRFIVFMFVRQEKLSSRRCEVEN